MDPTIEEPIQAVETVEPVIDATEPEPVKQEPVKQDSVSERDLDALVIGRAHQLGLIGKETKESVKTFQGTNQPIPEGFDDLDETAQKILTGYAQNQEAQSAKNLEAMEARIMGQMAPIVREGTISQIANRSGVDRSYVDQAVDRLERATGAKLTGGIAPEVAEFISLAAKGIEKESAPRQRAADTTRGTGGPVKDSRTQDVIAQYTKLRGHAPSEFVIKSLLEDINED